MFSCRTHGLEFVTLETLPLAIPEDIRTCEWSITAIVEAIIAVATLHGDSASRKEALRCFDRLSKGCSSSGLLEGMRADMRDAAQVVEEMLRGDLKYLDPATRRVAREVFAKLLAQDDFAVSAWMLVVLSSPQGLLGAPKPRYRVIGVFMLELLVEITKRPESWAYLVRCVQDSDPEVRGMACASLVHM